MRYKRADQTYPHIQHVVSDGPDPERQAQQMAAF